MKLDKIFSSHMVFSANKPIRIYGGGKGQATVVFNGVEKNVISDSDEWLVEFQPMNYGGPYELKFIYNSKESILDDIYVGEVYLFSGQSNMGLKIKETNVTEEEAALAVELFEKTGWNKKDNWKIKAKVKEILKK